jgi:hypothetical protein
VTGIRISQTDLDQVAGALDHWEREAAVAVAYIGGAGLSSVAIAALTGHGFAAPSLMFGLDKLVIGTLQHGTQLAGDAHQARSWGAALLGSQVMATSGSEWRDIGLKAFDLGREAGEGSKWLVKGGRYALHGTWAEHASRWKLFGHYKSTGVGIAGALLSLAGAFIPGAGGQIVEAAADLGVAGYGAAAITSVRYLEVFGGKVLGKVFLPFAAASVLNNVMELKGGDYKDLVSGDAQHHSESTRSNLYSAKVLDTIGTAALAIAPFTGPAAPVVAGVACVLMGAGAIIKGAVFITDVLHAHHVTAHSVESWGLNQAKHVASFLPHFL